MRNGRYAKRGARPFGGRRITKPSREWLCLPTTVLSNNAGAGATVQRLLQFEGPTLVAGNALTSDPPEDQILDRLICLLDLTGAGATGRLGLGILVVDTTWTPTGTTALTPDLDKRFLWWREIESHVVAESWTHNTFTSAAGVKQPNSCHPDVNPAFCDISPKVRLENGKSLCLVVYQDTALQQPVITVRECRFLMHRAGRR